MLQRLWPTRDRRDADVEKLIVGLGNPGEQHVQNRHNVGFQLVLRLAARHDLPFNRIESQSLMARGEVANQPTILLKPLTYMNESGKAVKPVVSRYKIRLQNVLMVYDDLDLPLGKLRLRAQGGAGGHKGMHSVIASLGSENIARLRIGIGRPTDFPPEQYVLRDFSLEESITMEQAYERAMDAAECFLREGITAAMNQYN